MKNTNSRRAFLGKAAAVTAAAAVAPLSGFGNGLEKAMEQTSRNSIPSDLRITDVKCGYVRGSLFVKILTNQDIYGCGEGVDAISGTYHLVMSMGRRLRGQSPFNIHRIFEDIRRAGFFGGAQSGVYVAVLSAIETALWDLCGKALGLPVYQLLGGKFRDSVRVYCDTALYRSRFPSPKEFADSAVEAVKLGFNALKFDLDYTADPDKFDRYNWTASQGELQRMYDQLAAVRQAVGPKIDIAVDMHGRYDLNTALAISRRVENLNLLWLEEPIPADNIEAYRLISQETGTPIAAGENIYLAYGFRKLLEIGGVDAIMPDLQKCGGLGEGQRIANLANLYYIPFAPHMVASLLGAMACAHVCVSVPNFLIMEWQSYFHTTPMYKEIVIFDEGNWVEKSFLKVSDKPGIGVDLNIEAMKKYAVQGVPFFE
ncbi:MAG TPA: mandelate racemase/muconate lactonizing enzyme family protein [Bacteroidales bacterium]|nr:mandelate racemase/muconate lactonizing enzyme family protein [Bacteroidales bacterium]HRR92715.1 mandelate racemase/muconate lactonizing enzyme family protein [Bacteroidales bacterium]HRT88821.1 mandelate racemase/muconate lactonizing enzyme family protein [Bacteroidales bacterium]